MPESRSRPRGRHRARRGGWAVARSLPPIAALAATGLLAACSAGDAAEAVARDAAATTVPAVPTMPPGASVPTPPTVPEIELPTTTVVLEPTDAPLALPFPWPSELDVSAAVEPSCVRPGGRATLRVATVPKAGVAYVATYAGNRGGAPPPFGDGLGSNDTYTGTWVVSPGAPPGPARVDVVVGREAEWGRAEALFAVADPVTGDCPA